MIEYDKFQKALKHLETQYGHYKTLSPDMEQWIQEGIAESVIQRFETCYDCMWKVLKRYLIEEVGLAEVPGGPKPLARVAYENNLLPTGMEQWLHYINARIGTAHDYSGEKAQETLDIVEDFIDDAIGLYQTMSKQTWE